LVRMISSESKTIIDDREAFAELYSKTALRAIALWRLLAQQRYARTIGEDDRGTHALMSLARISRQSQNRKA
jgi:hypothetical protein